MPLPPVNNFVYIYGQPKKAKSPYLSFYKKIFGYNIYTVTINPAIYVVHDELNNQYYNFERQMDSPFEVLDHDLETVINTYIRTEDS